MADSRAFEVVATVRDLIECLKVDFRRQMSFHQKPLMNGSQAYHMINVIYFSFFIFH